MRKEPIIKTVSQINANIGHMNNNGNCNSPINTNGSLNTVPGNNNNGLHNIPMMHPNPSAVIGQPNFREHIIRAPKLAAHLDLFSNNNNNNSTHNNNNLMTANNNNNNNHINHNNNNNNNLTMNNNNTNNNVANSNGTSPSKYVIHQTNTSNKILDNQKYHKYFSKRKMMAQYENEMQTADKRNRLMSVGSSIGVTEDLSQKSSRRSNSPSSISGCSDNNCSGSVSGVPVVGTNGNGNGNSICESSSGALDLNVSQNIKVEPDIVIANEEEDDDNSIEDSSSGLQSSHTVNSQNNNNHNNNECDSPRDLTASSTTAHADFYHNLADLTTKRSQHSHVVEHMAALAHIRADAENRSMSAAAAICSWTSPDSHKRMAQRIFFKSKCVTELHGNSRTNEPFPNTINQ